MAKLTEGTTVVMDRYAPSGVAFTVAKGSPGLDLEWCQNIERGKLPAPDVVFLMDLPVTQAAGRAEFGKEKYETQKFQQSVQSVFKQLMTREQWILVDGTRPLHDISEEILQSSLDMIQQCKAGRALQFMWQSSS